MNAFQIEDVPASSAEQLARLGRETKLENFVSGFDEEAYHDYVEETHAVSVVQQELDDSQDTARWVVRDGEPIAYSQLDSSDIRGGVPAPLPGEGLHLHRLYVLASCQGQGIGRALFEDAVSVAMEQNRSFIWLCAWDQNPEAINFYRHLGMVQFGEHAFTIGNGEYRDLLFCLRVR